MTGSVLLMLILLLLVHVVILVTGEFIKGLNLEWGVRLSCTKINLFSDITITACYEECLKREQCQSFNYVAHYKRCMLCANDGSAGDAIGSKYAGYVHSRKSKWKQELTTSACQCPATQACYTEDGNLQCRVNECSEQPEGPHERAIVLGNVMGVGSHVIYTCPANDLQEGGDGRLKCRDDGSWTAVAPLACSAYLGCYEDKSDRSLPSGPHWDYTGMTTERCRDICREEFPASEKFYFATQYSMACTCGIAAPKYPRTPENDCKMLCAGDQTQVCGGVWRMSVYQTFQTGIQPNT